MKNKSVKLPFITKNSKHLVQTICSQMKNKGVKLQFVTKNSKHFVGTICSHMKNKSVKLPFNKSQIVSGHHFFGVLSKLHVFFA